ncbi:MAG: YgiT-type zinc finger protein [Chloroflexi bacterium]|nr:YgiT-type zinc finger protein [Chloroflexota bacterium]
MIGDQENNGRCPLCGGHLSAGITTIPFIFADTAVLVKQVPAQICDNCREPFTIGAVTDRLVDLVCRVKNLHTEVSIVSYAESERVYA